MQPSGLSSGSSEFWKKNFTHEFCFFNSSSIVHIFSFFKIKLSVPFSIFFKTDDKSKIFVDFGHKFALQCTFFKFVDDANIMSTSRDEIDNGGKLLQEYLEKLFSLRERWGMTFNYDRFEKLLITTQCSQKVHSSRIGTELIDHAEKKSALGFTVSFSGKIQDQCVKARKTANSLLAMKYERLKSSLKNVFWIYFMSKYEESVPCTWGINCCNSCVNSKKL